MSNSYTADMGNTFLLLWYDAVSVLDKEVGMPWAERNCMSLREGERATKNRWSHQIFRGFQTFSKATSHENV